MTKKRIIGWVEEQKNKRVGACNKEYYKAKERLMDEILEDMGTDDTAKKIAFHIQEIKILLSEWGQKLGDRGKLCACWASFAQRLDNADTPDEVKDVLKNRDIEFTDPRFDQLYNTCYETIKNIKTNYDNVVFNLQKLKNAKVCLEYLQELGFDLSELKKEDEEPVETALSTPVDVKFLFLGVKDA